MPSGTQKGLTRLSLLLLTVPVLPGCVAAKHIALTPAACSTLVPTDWRAGVPAAPLPDGSTVGDWIAFGDAQTGQLDKANGRTKDTIDIISRCEARDAAALKGKTK